MAEEKVSAATPGAKADVPADESAEAAAGAPGVALAKLEKALIAKIDKVIDGLRTPNLDEENLDHLEVLRSLLKAEAAAYLGHFKSRREALFSSTSKMYAHEVGPAGVRSTTLRGLLESDTINKTQATRLASFMSDHRLLVIFGDRATGKSTLLNALLGLISVDERIVSIERRQHLPALEDRSFCVRLSIDKDTDLPGLFSKAMRMQPNRVVIGELHGQETVFFLRLLADNHGLGGFCTLRDDSVHKAVERLVQQLESTLNADEAKRILGQTRPVLVHMRSDEKGLPRMAAIWSVEGQDAKGEILISQDAAGGAAAELAAEA